MKNLNCEYCLLHSSEINTYCSECEQNYIYIKFERKERKKNLRNKKTKGEKD